MSNLNNLIDQITASSKQKATQIVADAETVAQKISADQARVADREKESILAQAQEQATRITDMTTVTQSLIVRDEGLKIKYRVMDDVFSTAIDRLNNMPEARFVAFVADSLAGRDLAGYEILLPQKQAGLLPKINEALAGKGCTGTLTLGHTERAFVGGFVICKDGVEDNHIFETLVNYYRNEMEAQVLKILY